MSWFNPFSLSCVLVGVTFYIAALIFSNFPPKKINPIYGYRTHSSMKSEERWVFAQLYSNSVMQHVGIFFIVIAPLGIIWRGDAVWSMGVFLALMVGALFYLVTKVERAIKDKFES